MPPLPLTLSRALVVAAVFVTFGTLLIRTTVAGAAQPSRLRALAWLQWAALSVAGAGLLAWSAMQTAAMAQTDGMAATVAAMPEVLLHTDFGRLVLLRGLLLALTALALAAGRRWPTALATVLAGLAAALQAAHLHALAMQPGPSLLLAAEGLHMLAAAAWLGGLPALLILVAGAPPAQAAAVARRFSPFGIAAVLALAGSAAVQGWTLIGSWAALFGTLYGRVCLAKLAVFALLVGLAARNRQHLVPRLEGGSASGPRQLTLSVAAAILLGAAVLVLAALLSGLAPVADMAGALAR